MRIRFHPGCVVLLFAGVVLAADGLEQYRLDLSCESDTGALSRRIENVVDRFGGHLADDVTPGGRRFSIPLLGGDASIVEFSISRNAGSCQIKAVGAMTSPGVIGTPPRVTNVPPPRMEFLMQALNQELSSSDSENPSSSFPLLDGRVYTLQSLIVPYFTPFYVRDKVLGADKGVYTLAALYVLLEASSVLLLSTEGDRGQRAIGISGLVFVRLFALGFGPVFTKMNRNFSATGYSYDPEKRYRIR